MKVGKHRGVVPGMTGSVGRNTWLQAAEIPPHSYWSFILSKKQEIWTVSSSFQLLMAARINLSGSGNHPDLQLSFLLEKTQTMRELWLHCSTAVAANKLKLLKTLSAFKNMWKYLIAMYVFFLKQQYPKSIYYPRSKNCASAWIYQDAVLAPSSKNCGGTDLAML